MGDHRVTPHNITIIDSITVLKINIFHVNSGKAPQIEIYMALERIATTSMVKEAKIRVITIITMAIEGITVINPETIPTMDINKTIAILTEQENHHC